jgi:hypothetical protein
MDGSSFVRDNHKNVIADVWQDSISNLRLIAAAPDLLAALIAIRNQLSSGNVVASDVSHALAIARAAVAKAEGQQ